MNYLKLSYGLLLCLFVSVTLSAQGPGRRGPRPAPGQNMEAILDKLDLNAEQESAMKTLMEETQTQMRALREQTFENPQDRRAAARKIMESQKEKVAEILTEDQLNQMKSLHEEKGPARGPRSQLDKAQREALHEELKTYQDENIAPVLAAQRLKLEDKITTGDKETIDEIRAEVKEKRAEHKSAIKSGERPMRKSAEQRKSGERSAHQGKIKTLMDTYGADIEVLLKEIAPKAEQWHQDLEDIHEKYAPEKDRERRMGHAPKGRREGRNAKLHQAPEKTINGRMEKGHAVRFLLMDPKVPSATGILEEDRFGLEAYPNPTNSIATVTYTVTERGKVRIILRNKTGNLNQVLLDAFKEPGDYTLEVDLSNLQDGLYFYTISNSAGGESLTKQLIINK